MKNIFKRLCSLFLLLFVVFTVISCGTNVIFSIDTVSRIGVGEEFKVKLNVNVDDFEIVEIKSSDDDVLHYQDLTIKGISIGEAELIAIIKYDEKEYKASLEIEVYKKYIDNFSVSISAPSKITIGEEANVIINANDDQYEVLEIKSSNSEVLEYNNRVIKGINKGTAELSIIVLYNSKEYESSINVEVCPEKPKYELEVMSSTELAVGEINNIFLFEKITSDFIEEYTLLSSNENVIKVENGKLKALSVGVATIVISTTYDEVELIKEIEFTVVAEKEQLFGINLPNKIYAGQLFAIEVTHLQTNIKVEEFTIESSDLNLFEYYPEFFEAQSYDEGDVTLKIIAKYNGIIYTQELDITILPALSLEIDLPNQISTKEPISFKVYLNPGNIEITEYSVFSTNKKILTIDNGIVTPLDTGKTMLSLSCEYDGAVFSSSHNLEIVRYYPESISTNIQEVMFINESNTISASIEPTGIVCDNFEIISSDSEVISVSDKTIKALKEGTSEITVKTNDLEQKYQIEVVTFGDIELIIDSSISLKEVVSFKVVATPSNKEIKNFNYISSNNDVLLINQNLIFGKDLGNASVTVSYVYNNITYQDTKDVTVQKIEHPIERLYISGSNAIIIGKTTEININKYPSNGAGEVILFVEDKTIVNIQDNKITGIKKGKTNIIARVENTNIETKFEITVISSKELSEVKDGLYNGNQLVARYYEESITMYNELVGGIVQTTYQGYTSTQLPGDVDGYSGITGDIVPDQYYEQQVNILEVPSSKDIKIVPWADLDNNKWSLTTVRGLIKHYESMNPGYRVVAAVNGDFFDIKGLKNLPYSTTGENITDGEFYKTFNSHHSGGGTLGFTNDGSNISLIGGSHAVYNSYMTLAIYDENGNIIKEFKVEKFNEVPGENQTSVYYGVYNENKQYVPIESLDYNTWVVSQAELALPNDILDFYGKGIIDSTSKTNLQIGQFAITSNNPEVQAALNVGTKIRVQFEFNENDKFANVTSATGYNCIIYDNDHGISYTDDNVLNRAPRTVIGMKADGTIVMMVVDGRQGGDGMHGCDGYELTAIMRAYGCVSAYNVDGGGSSTMVIRTDSGLVVTNSPSDGRERNDGNCILICVADPTYQTTVSNETSTSAVINITCTNEEFNNKDLYVKMDGKFYEVVDGKVEITGLVHNNEYSYRVYYKENGEYIITQTIGVIKTLQIGFKYLGLTIQETEDSFIINSYADDIDKCGNVNEMSISFNDIDLFLKDGTLTISKSLVGNKILSFEIEYIYYLEGERIKVVDENPEYFLLN